MKKIILLSCLFWFAKNSQCQSLYFPPIAGNTWDTLSAASLGWCTDKVDTLYDYLEANNSKAFILLKDGKIVFEKYFGTFTVDSIWYWASAGKSLTSFVVGMAQQESFLSVHDTTSDYLGTGWTIAPAQKELAITIRNQLTMTSGLDDGVPDNHCTEDTCLKYLADAGTRWAYHNAPYTLLDSVIESATGSTLNNYLQQKIKTPTGMTGLYVKVDYDNVYYSKPRSMARYGLLMLNRGKWDNTPILTDTTYYNSMINTSQALNPSYGYLWWLNGKSSYMVPGLQIQIPGSLSPHAPADMYAALGKNGQMLNIVPSQNLVWLRMGNAPNAGLVPFLMNDTIWEKLNLIMCTPNTVTDINKQKVFIEIYPNPVASSLWVDIKNTLYNVEMTDLSGRQLLQKKNNIGKSMVNTESIQDGIYLLSVITQNDKQVFKIQIAH